MKEILFALCLFLSFSCASRSQGKGDNANDSTENSSKNNKSSDTLSLLFVGDLMQHYPQVTAAKTAGGYDYTPCFQYVKEQISKADIAIGNLEVTLAGKPYSGYPTFSAPDEFLYAIHNAGFDVLLTANNHCLDRGKKGLKRTIQLLDSLNIPHAGTYNDQKERDKKYPLLLEKKGFRIALLSYTYGTNGIPVSPPNIVNYIDTVMISRDIKVSNSFKPDAIIVYIHWGDEYQSLPNKEQKHLANWMLSKGVTHIIGTHPHVVQPIEVREDTLSKQKHLIVYSLGNFISNMSARNTGGGLMVSMELVKDSITRMSDCYYNLVWTVRPVQSGKKNYFLFPIDMPADSLSASVCNSLNIFKNDTRKLFEKHNIGIREEVFPKKYP